MNDIKVPPFMDVQKEVIEATKKICNGKKVCDVDDDIDVLTNDEWRRTCSTEEFAKWMAEEKMCRGYFIFPSMEEAIQDALEWLKEKHNG